MQTQSEAAPRHGRPLIWVLGGCGALLACAILACAANAIYWTLAGPPSGAIGPLAERTLVAYADLPGGVQANGERLFVEAGCSACHSLEPDVTLVGPSLAGVGSRAATRHPDLTAEAYLLESILKPSEYVVPGFHAGLMPDTFQWQLSAQELADLVAFLLAQ
jgi:cytochrome c551/c552